MTKTVLSLALLVHLVFGAGDAFAFSTGITTTSFANPADGCNNLGCHAGGIPPTVTLTGPASVSPDSVNEYLVTILEVGSQSHGGFNASADTGALTVGGGSSSGTQSLAGGGGLMEITHTTPKASVAGETTFTFLWQAPSSGSATLRAWGNAVNFNGNNLGDAASLATLGVNVLATPVPTASPSPSPTPTASPTPTPGPPPAVPTMRGPTGPAALIVLLLLAGFWILAHAARRD